MAFTTHYNFATRLPEDRLNAYTVGHQHLSEVIGLANGGFAAVYASTDVADSFPLVEFFNPAMDHVVHAIFPGDFGIVDLVGAPEIVQLANGNVAVIWAEGGDGENELMGAIVNPNTGLTVVDQFSISPFVDNIDPEATALANGNFVVAYSFGNGNGIAFDIVTPTGAQVTAHYMGNAGDTDPVVTALAGGGFVITHTDTFAGNGEIRAQIYDDNGDVVRADYVIATSGANTQPAVAALANGNFAVAYTDTGWGAGDGITLQIFDAAGNTVTGFIRVDTNLDALEFNPDITVLDNGFIVVSWEHEYSVDDHDLRIRVFDADGVPVEISGTTDAIILAGETTSELDMSISSILGGQFAYSYTDLAGDGDGSQILGGVKAITHSWISDGAGDVMNGDSLADIMYGNGGADTLNGNGGNDGLIGGEGADALNGGAGTDTASYSGSSGPTVVSLTTGIGSGGAAEGDALTGIENLEGSDYADNFTGDSGANRLWGSGDDDTLNGAGGNDNLFGGTGDDFMTGGLGADHMDGGTDNDTVNYQSSGDAVHINFSALTYSGGHANGDYIINVENAIGSVFDDVLTGNGEANILNGHKGNDVLAGLAGADDLIGGAGIDTADYSASNAGVFANLGMGVGGGGHSTGDTYLSIENVTGSAHGDNLLGDALANVLSGAGSNDVLIGMGGGDTLDGGDGIDTAAYLTSNGVTVSLLSGFTLGGHAGGDKFISIENLGGSAFADELTGDTGNNQLNGGAGADFLNGSNGMDALFGDENNDVLIGGMHGDVIAGGDGFDTASYVTSNGGVVVNLFSGTTAGAHAAGDTLASVENLLGSGFVDFLTGDAGVNVLDGYNGDDVLKGLGGADTLKGGNGVDRADYTDSDAGVTVSLLSGVGTGGHAAGDILQSIENVFGSAFADVLTGSTGANTINAGGGADEINASNGNDTILGGAGNDSIVGGAGADAIDGGADTDTAWFANSDAAVTVNLATGTGSGGHAEGDTYVSIEWVGGSVFDDTITGDSLANLFDGGLGHDTLNGGGNDDTLIGQAGNDTLIGGTGNDTLVGGAGNDTLSGYLGEDIFGYELKAFGNDTIIGFENGVDLIDISSAGLTFADFTETAAGPGTILTFHHNGVDHSITLLGVAPGLIDANDFIM